MGIRWHGASIRDQASEAFGRHLRLTNQSQAHEKPVNDHQIGAYQFDPFVDQLPYFTRIFKKYTLPADVVLAR